MPQYTMNIDANTLAKYLRIAFNQRQRAVKKFEQDYGPGSATVKEVSEELAELNKAIIDVTLSPTKK